MKSKKEKLGFWLYHSVPFDHGLGFRLVDEVREVIEGLFNEIIGDKSNMYSLEKKLLDFKILCANLLKNRQDHPTAISLNRNEYRPNRYQRALYFVIDLVYLMESKGFIEMKKGYRDTKNPKESRNTRIWPTEKFLERFKKCNFLKVMYI